MLWHLSSKPRSFTRTADWQIPSVLGRLDWMRLRPTRAGGPRQRWQVYTADSSRKVLRRVKRRVAILSARYSDHSVEEPIRGSLMDLDALVEGLGEKRPAIAALDVYPDEPLDSNCFRRVSEQVMLTPHMAWYTEESHLDLRQESAPEAARAQRGERLLNPVGARGPKGGAT